MGISTVLSTQTLSEHLLDSEWLVVDCRFSLSDPHWGLEEYRKAHIPGAVFADLNLDLSSPITANSGRHPLPDPDKWRATLSGWGLQPETQVVAYDSNGGSMAATRLWWLLRAYGHFQVALLDGGLPKWTGEGRPVSNETPPRRHPAPFTGVLDLRQMATSEEVLRQHRDPRYRLIDTRAPERFRGEVEPIDPVAGHIPGARNRPLAQNLNPDLTFKPAGQLRQEFNELLEGASPENVIAYCGSGVTACHNLLAMEIAGLFGGKLYPGSWSEWIRDPERPVESGVSGGSSR
jgi:thiosulfate/3-mercaptopyruvate sulfurtransferase